jgi:hypothetical protein
MPPRVDGAARPAPCAGAFVLLLAAAGLAACAGGRYQCPQPIGTIIRDDCSDYKTRYDSLAVGLSAGISKLQVSASVGREALRDPSELVQILSARMLALCHDFNACRLTPAEYRRRRDELDRTATAIAALGDQLAAPDLNPAERRRVLDRLLDLLAPPGADPAPVTPAKATATEEPKKAAEPERVRPVYASTIWFGSVLAPPLAPPPAAGFPRLLSRWLHQDLQANFGRDVVGYRPRLRLKLFGPHEADDALELTFDDGQQVRCAVKTNGDGVFAPPECGAPQDMALTAERFRVRVAYVRGADGQRAELGVIEQPVARATYADTGDPRVHYGIDLDAERERAWLFFLPEDYRLPADYERPHLRVVLRVRKAPGHGRFAKGTVRCFHDGESLGPAVRHGRGSGQEGWFQDKSSHVRTGPGSSRAAKDPILEWKRYVFALPFRVRRTDSATPPPEAERWPPAVGRVSCQVRVAGELVRRVRFTLDADGRPQPLPAQRGEPGDLVHPWWLVENEIVSNGVEGDWARGEPGT